MQVQGVYFRKFTVQKATALKLVGWVANTMHGTVGEQLMLLSNTQRQQEQQQQQQQWQQQHISATAVYVAADAADFQS
jgi:acylphosphatase